MDENEAVADLESGVDVADIYLHCKADVRGIETKKIGDDEIKVGVLEGFASTADIDEVRDIVLPSAFEDSLPAFKENPNLFWMHNPAEPIGIVATADIREGGADDQGLWVRTELNLDTTRGSDAWKLSLQGAVKHFSIGYKIPDGGIEYNSQIDAFIISKINLFEVSIVSIPANRNATFGLGKQMQVWADHQHKYKLGRRSPSPEELKARKLRLQEADETKQLLRGLVTAGATMSAVVSTVAEAVARASSSE